MDEKDGQERLGSLRAQVDGIDRTIVELIAQRIGRAASIAEAKRALGQEIYNGDRENEILTQLGTYARSLGLEPDVIRNVYEPIFRYMRDMQHG